MIRGHRKEVAAVRRWADDVRRGVAGQQWARRSAGVRSAVGGAGGGESGAWAVGGLSPSH
jgi:hypothetical protein